MPKPEASSGPEDDEIELSVFGPGVGEAAAVHVGAGDWILVDSCVDARTRQPAPLAYLESLGVDPSKAVKWVVATHAHDDHVEGLAQVVRTCGNAEVVLPASSSQDEFLALARLDDRLAYYQTRWSIYSEFRDTFNEMTGPRLAMLHWATAGLELPLGASSRGDAVKLLFVAPSGAAVARSKRAMGHLLRAAVRSDSAARVSRKDPNSFCSALIIHVGQLSLLLGGDVLVGTSTWGWHHIVDHFNYRNRIDGSKVAHHGSVTGYHPAVWTDWLKPSAICVVTPYRSSSLPKPADIARMKEHGVPVFQTARSTKIAASKQTKRTSARIRAVTLGPAEEVEGIMGHVQVRWRDGVATTKTFGPAFQA